MNIRDISWPISADTTAYKDRKVIEIIKTKNFQQDNVRETKIIMGAHSGTHVDAPSHFLKDGNTIEKIKLEQLIGPCTILELTLVQEKITADDLKKFDIKSNDIILLKTKNSERKATDVFDYDFIYLDASGAQYLADKKIKAVGIDYLGIESKQKNHPTHKTLMNADIPIIEGLRLQDVEDDNYFFVCLPLNIIGNEAAPARAVLFKEM